MNSNVFVCIFWFKKGKTENDTNLLYETVIKIIRFSSQLYALNTLCRIKREKQYNYNQFHKSFLSILLSLRSRYEK